MKTTALFLFLLFPILLSAKDLTIGVYNSDSVIAAVPSLKARFDSIAHFKQAISGVYDQMVEEYEIKKIEAKNDSFKWSPLIKSLKMAEITDLKIHIANFEQEADKETTQLSLKVIDDINKQIATVCGTIAKRDQLISVQSNPRAIVWIDNSIEFRNITNELIAELNKK
ncbi:MAG TPA: OmpH family outer membrane protein [Bacteroidia bacterium]|jgi:Skp family chaperone for outer membrane proteins|nr:OmpH family outer membrane protein [Bacteroidia bacterium]